MEHGWIMFGKTGWSGSLITKDGRLQHTSVCWLGTNRSYKAHCKSKTAHTQMYQTGHA